MNLIFKKMCDEKLFPKCVQLVGADTSYCSSYLGKNSTKKFEASD
jgi:hypothetical protein